jgi:chromate reductase, NAD(P)H dehydrogenase (quinone)
MAKGIKILGIAGSVRKASFNKSALRAAQKLVPEGASIEIFDIDGLPGFNQDEEKNPPAKVTELKAKIRAADAILFVTPEYNYSIPGVLKNAIDWASRPYGKNSFNGKPTAGIGASGGAIGTAAAQQHLRSILAYLNVTLMGQPEGYIAFKPGLVDDQHNVTDESVRKFLQTYVDAFATWVERYGKK